MCVVPHKMNLGGESSLQGSSLCNSNANLCFYWVLVQTEPRRSRYNRMSIGPGMEPCGIPTWKDACADHWPSIIIVKDL